MYEIDKELWLAVLEYLSFSESDHDMVFQYIENHINHEVGNNMTMLDSNILKPSTLSSGLKVLEKLDLSKIQMVEMPIFVANGVPTKCGTYKQPDFVIQDPELPSEEYIGSIVIEETVKYFNEILESDSIYLYTMLSGINRDGGVFSLYHRFVKK